MDRIGIPVVAGLAVGIVLVVLFSTLFVTGGNAVNRVSIVTVPKDSSSGDGSFEPKIIKISFNSTVMWINKDEVPSSIAADNEGDPAFFNATYDESGRPKIILLPDGSFEFTFTMAGKYGYYDPLHPWMRGSVVGEPRL